MALKIVEPPAAMIDWHEFSYQLQISFATQYRMVKQVKLSASTRNNAWHGRSIGVLPFLRLCKAMEVDPLRFLVER